MRFRRTSLLQLPQGSVDLGERLHSGIQIGEVHFPHIGQHSQLVEVVADGLLLTQDFLESIKNDNAFSETTKLSADELGLREMLSPDGVTKARKAALERLRSRYPGSGLHLWRDVYHALKDI